MGLAAIAAAPPSATATGASGDIRTPACHATCKRCDGMYISADMRVRVFREAVLTRARRPASCVLRLSGNPNGAGVLYGAPWEHTAHHPPPRARAQGAGRRGLESAADGTCRNE